MNAACACLTAGMIRLRRGALSASGQGPGCYGPGGRPRAADVREALTGIYAERVLPRIVEHRVRHEGVEPVARAGVRGPPRPGGRDRVRVRPQRPVLPGRRHGVAAIEPADLGWKLAGDAPRGDDGAGASDPGWTASRCRCPTTAATRRCRRGRCAPSPTWPRRCARCGGCSSRAGRCTSSSTGWRRTRRCSAGSTASSRCRSASSAGATSPVRSPTCSTEAGFAITEIDVFYEKGAPKIIGADSLGVAEAA